MGSTRVIDAARLAENQGRLDLTVNEMRTLASLLLMQTRKRPRTRYLEIGVFGGGTLFFLREVAPQVQYFGVDLFEDLQTSSGNTHISGNYSKEAVQQFLGPDVTLIKGDSSVVLPQLRETFDLIFVDGNHRYDATKIDFENADRILAPGGIIALHNASAWGNPDFEEYNRFDGGPWQLATELRLGSQWRVAAEVDRLVAFARAQA